MSDQTRRDWYGSSYGTNPSGECFRVHADVHIVAPSVVQLTLGGVKTSAGAPAWACIIRADSDPDNAASTQAFVEGVAADKGAVKLLTDRSALAYIPTGDGGGILRAVQSHGPLETATGVDEIMYVEMPRDLLAEMASELSRIAALAVQDGPFDESAPAPGTDVYTSCDGCDRPLMSHHITHSLLRPGRLAAELCELCMAGETLRALDGLHGDPWPRQRAVLEAVQGYT